MNQMNYQDGNNTGIIFFKNQNIENALPLNLEEQRTFFCHVGFKSHLNLFNKPGATPKGTKPA